MDPFAFLLVVLFLWGPSMSQEGTSRCYFVDYQMRQARPCLAHETR